MDNPLRPVIGIVIGIVGLIAVVSIVPIIGGTFSDIEIGSECNVNEKEWKTALVPIERTDVCKVPIERDGVCNVNEKEEKEGKNAPVPIERTDVCKNKKAWKDALKPVEMWTQIGPMIQLIVIVMILMMVIGIILNTFAG